MRSKKASARQARRLAAIFALFQKNLPPDGTTDTAIKSNDETYEFSRIRCPLCKWQPQASSRWCCAGPAHPPEYYDGCWTEWNTFDTRGRCPGCQHQWIWTSCLRCSGWSLHEDWYAKEDKA